MSLIETIAQRAQQAGLPFLVIGGYAVMAHGFVRATDDLDLLVQSSRRQQWCRLLEELGMKVFHEMPAFTQFEPPPNGRLPVDLMLVNDHSLRRMEASATTARDRGVALNVVSLHHLIALKCHAIKHSKQHRKLMDADDIIRLIRINRLDLNEPELRATILKHGDQELYDKLQRACASE